MRTRAPGAHRRHRTGRRWSPAQWSPLLLTVAITLLAASKPRDFAVSRLLPAAPALAASMWSVAATIALGVLALVAVLLMDVAYHPPTPLYTAAAVVAVTAAAAYAGHIRLQRERTLNQVRSVAAAVQSVVLRPLPHRLGPVDIETLYLAAAEEARVGGDFYEAVQTPYGVRVVLGDVRGKGLSAVGVAGAVTNSFREAAHDEADLAGLARRLDTALARYSALLPDAADAAERFATAVLAQIPTAGGPAQLLNCGHPPPLVLRAAGAERRSAAGDGAGEVVALEPARASPPLNMGALVGGGYAVDTVVLEPGDRLLLYTDGVTETRDRSGGFFPLSQWTHGQTSASPRALLDRLHESLLRFSGGALDDDMAALVLRYDPVVSVPPGSAV